DITHYRAFGLVAVSPASKYGDDLVVRELQNRFEGLFQGVWRVRVIHQHRKRLPAIDGLHPARNALQRLDSVLDVLELQSQADRGAHRGKDIVDIRAPYQPGGELQLAFRSPDPQVRSIDAVAKIQRAYVRFRAEAVAQDLAR